MPARPKGRKKPSKAPATAGALDDAALVVFRRDPQSGTLTYVETQHGGVTGVEGMRLPNFVRPSPDGAYLYVSSYDAVVVFARDAATGQLTFVQA